MEELKEQIRNNARYLGKGIIKADAFINHQLLPGLTTRIGNEFARVFREAGITRATRILTAEVSGIAPALVTAQALNIPMVFARKKCPAFMSGSLFSAQATSRTKKEEVTLYLSSQFLSSDDRVLIVDDFLATASTLKALASIVRQSGATLLGIGCVIEKPFEGGRKALDSLSVPVISLAKINLTDSGESFSVS